jgi:N-acetylglucosaminyl-diphospho-decaprenol L-rhamnosyltransferase
MPPEPLDVEISLVNTSNRELLRSCMRSIPAACEGLSWHATVVDNASTDGSAEMAASEAPWARVVRNETRLGFSANHNQVIVDTLERGLARYVLILNEDTVLEAGSVAELVRFCDAEAHCGAAGPVIVDRHGLVEQSLFPFPTIVDQVRASLVPGRLNRPPPPAGWLNGSCVLVRAEALREIGPLDERFFIFFEDTDLGFRLAVAGWTSLICERARIVHLGHKTVSQRPLGDSMERQMLRSRYLYFRKHEGPARALAVAGLVRVALAARATKALAAGFIGKDRGERDLASYLWRLARYDPRGPLPHESSAEAPA